MKKYINVRLPCIMAVSLVIGIALAFVIEFYNINRNFVWAGVAVVAIFALIVGLTVKSLRPLIFTVLALGMLATGIFGCGFAKIDGYKKTEISSGKPYFVEGTVEDVVVRDSSVYAIIGKVTVNENTELDGKLCATIYNYEARDCKIGCKVKFLADLEAANDLFAYGEVTYNAVNDYKYRCYVGSGVEISGTASPFAQVRGRIHDVLFDNLNYETAAICYGMLIGDTNEIEYPAMQTFRYGGVAHVFAVSGLHIGLVYAVFYLLFRKTLMNGSVAAILSVAVIFLYAGVCGFTLSSMRAAIMCTVGAAAKLFRLKYDGLNSLAYSVIIILLIRPFSLFSLGFQLSVCSVAGICFFSRFFAKLLKKIKTPDVIASAVSVSVAAQAGTLPVMLNGFGYLSGAGLTMNIVVMPVVSALFYLIFAGTALAAAILPIAEAVVPVVALPLEGVLSLILSLGFEKALIRGFGGGIFIPLYYIGALTFTDKINFGFKVRLIAFIGAVATLVAVAIIKTLHLFGGYSVIVASNQRCESVIIKSSQGTVLIINDGCDGDARKILSRHYSANLDAVVVVGDEDTLFAFVRDDVRCENIYASADLVPLQPYNFATVNYGREFSVCGIDFRFADAGNLYAECGGAVIGIANSDNLNLSECDILIGGGEIAEGDADIKVSHSARNVRYNNYDCGDLKFSIKDGEVRLTQPVRG